MAASPSTRAEVAIEAACSLAYILGLALGSPHSQGLLCIQRQRKLRLRINLIQIEFPGTVIEKLHYNLASNGLAFLCDLLRNHSLEKFLWQRQSQMQKPETDRRLLLNPQRHGVTRTTRSKTSPADVGAAATLRFQHRHEIHFTPLPPAAWTQTAVMSHMQAWTCVRSRIIPEKGWSILRWHSHCLKTYSRSCLVEGEWKSPSFQQQCWVSKRSTEDW